MPNIFANPSQEDISQLFHATASWLLHELNYAVIKEAKGKLEKLSINEVTTRALLCKEFASLLQKNFSHFLHKKSSTIPLPTLIVFSWLSRKVPRNDQIEDLTTLMTKAKQKGGCILQKGMGGGKTAVILALLAYTVRKPGEKFPVLFVDSSQYQAVSSALKTSQSTCFGQKTFSFNFCQDALTPERLSWIIEQLKVAVKRGNLLIVCIQMIQLLDEQRFLLAKQLAPETSPNAAQDNQKILKKLSLLQEIFTYFKRFSVPLGDEAHLLFRTDVDLNIPLGTQKGLPEECIDLAESVFLLLCDPKHLDLKNAIGLLEDKQWLVTKEQWTGIRKKIATEMLRRAPFKQLSMSERDLFIQFISNGVQQKDTWKVKKFLLSLKNQSARGEKERLLAELTGFLRTFLDTLEGCFKNKGNKNFGRLGSAGGKDAPQKAALKVVPYLAVRTPSVSTEFSSTIAALIYHMMTALQEKITTEHIKILITQMEEAAHKEREFSQASIDQTSSGQSFKKAFEISLSEAIEQKSIIAVSLQKRINKKPRLRLQMERFLIRTHVKGYPSQTTSTAQVLPDLMGPDWKVMTGTPENRQSFPAPVDAFLKPDRGFNGSIAVTLLQRSQDYYRMKTPSLLSLCNSLFEKRGPKFCDGIFDMVAMFKQHTNRQVAQTLCTFCSAKNIEKKGVIFFDQKTGAPAVLLVGEKNSIPLDGVTPDDLFVKTNAQPEDFIVFLDESKTTGTDYAFSPTGHGVVTIDKSMKISKLNQTLLRLRGYLHGQTASFALSEEFYRESPIDNFGVYLLHIALSNQAIQNAQALLQSFPQQIQAIAKERFRSSWLTDEKWVKKVPEALKAYKCLLFTQNSDDLLQHLHVPELTSVEKHLASFYRSLLKQFEAAVDKMLVAANNKIDNDMDLQIVRRLQFEDYPYLCEQFDKFFEKMQGKKDFLPENVQSHFAVSATTQTQTQTQGQAQTETETEEKKKEIDPEKFEEKGQKKWTLKQQRQLILSLQNSDSLENQDITLFSDALAASSTDKMFGPLFSKDLFVSNSFHKPFTKDISIFNPAYRPAETLLIVQKTTCEREENSFSVVLLTQQEAHSFLWFLKNNKVKNAWLASIDGRPVFEALSPFPLPNQPQLRELLAETLLLNGEVTSIFRNSTIKSFAKTWIEKNYKLAKKYLKNRLVSPEKEAFFKSPFWEACESGASFARQGQSAFFSPWMQQMLGYFVNLGSKY